MGRCKEGSAGGPAPAARGVARDLGFALWLPAVSSQDQIERLNRYLRESFYIARDAAAGGGGMNAHTANVEVAKWLRDVPARCARKSETPSRRLPDQASSPNSEIDPDGRNLNHGFFP